MAGAKLCVAQHELARIMRSRCICFTSVGHTMSMSTDSQAQRRLDELLDHLPAGVVVHGPDGRIRSANRLARELLGRTDAQLLGSGTQAATWNFVRPDKSPMAPADYPVNVVLRTRAKVKDLIVGLPGNGPESARWLICNAYPEFDGGGALSEVVVCFTDCTALKAAKQRLEKSEERLRLVLQGSTDAPWDWDLVTGEVYYSERWWSMLGYAPGELPADARLWLRLAHPDDKTSVAELTDKLYGDGGTVYSIELRLRHRDGHYVPVLSRGFVLRDATGRPLRVSGTNTDLTERKAAERRIYRLVNFDQLTGLPNRRYLVEELDKVLARGARSGQFGAVLGLGLDNFKLVNDTIGRSAGDALLRQVAQRLRHTLRHSDQLARVDGDTFVIVLEEQGPSASEAVAETSLVARKILSVLGRAYQLSGRPLVASSSIGVVMFDSSGASAETMLKQANLAMHQAKAEGRNLARFFDPGMQHAADRQAALERALHDEVSLDQFVLFCQPQFSGDGVLIGAEVLVRWRRDDGELVGPDDFIGLAESSGLIVTLGRHVLEGSCRALARWRANPALAKVKLGVNVSVQQLRAPGFPELVAAILACTGAPSDKLCLELTESVFADDMEVLKDTMHRICRQGVDFSLDDFGTGYSSLAYLRRFPLAGLKIDRSFVHDVHRDPDAVPIVRAIIALAHTLKLDIVAEGVEHEAQRRFLIDGGCSTLQGFLLGVPVPIEEFERLHGVAGA
jgi:diguanylate cyclase (GGDEF)-like protein/PAS domain S-box-containing protein